MTDSFYKFSFFLTHDGTKCDVEIHPPNLSPIQFILEDPQKMQSVKYLIYSLSEKKTNPFYKHNCSECVYSFEDEHDWNVTCPICKMGTMNSFIANTPRYDLRVRVHLWKQNIDSISDKTSPFFVELMNILHECCHYHIHVLYN